MAKKKVSPKVQQNAEQYLVSLGSSRELLTDKQWEIVTNFIKAQRIRRWVTVFFLFMALS